MFKGYQTYRALGIAVAFLARFSFEFLVPSFSQWQSCPLEYSGRVAFIRSVVLLDWFWNEGAMGGREWGVPLGLNEHLLNLGIWPKA